LRVDCPTEQQREKEWTHCDPSDATPTLYVVGADSVEVFFGVHDAGPPAASELAELARWLIAHQYDETVRRALCRPERNQEHLFQADSIRVVLERDLAVQAIRRDLDGDGVADVLLFPSLRSNMPKTHFWYFCWMRSSASGRAAIVSDCVPELGVRADGDAYLLLRDNDCGTGMRGWQVHRVTVRGTPLECVYADFSRSD
jgi:hypothetical protein